MIPALAPYPPDHVRRMLPAEEWTSAQSLYSSALEVRLRLDDTNFTQECAHDSDLIRFIVEYVEHEKNEAIHHSQDQKGPAAQLRKYVFSILHRFLAGTANAPKAFVSAEFLRDLCRLYPRSGALREVLRNLWIKNAVALESSISGLASSAVKLLQTATPPEEIFDSLIPLIRLSPDAAQFFVAGADFTDSLFQNFCEHRAIVVKTTYALFKSLLEAPKPNASLFYDQVYNLVYNEDGILRALLSSTPLLSKLSMYTSSNSRLETLYDTLMTKYAADLDIYTPRSKSPAKDKGKGKARSYSPGLAPTAEPFVPRQSVPEVSKPEIQQPKPTRFKAPPPISQILVHDTPAKANLPSAPSELKSTILSLLEEDERDDTYDDVDTALPGPDTRPPSPSAEDALLYQAWTNNRDAFSREARRSNARKHLLDNLGDGWTDERVEGWAAMLERDPRKQRELGSAAMLEGGRNANPNNNVQIGGRWRQGMEEEGGTQFDRGRGGRPRGRGRGRGGLGRGDSVVASTPGEASGSSSNNGPRPTDTARGRARKEHNKGRVQREGRARKLARGGMLPG